MKQEHLRQAALGAVLVGLTFAVLSVDAFAQYSSPCQPGMPGCSGTAPPQGEVFRGAARGAARGALIGSISGNAGRGAAIGATVGGVFGAGRRAAYR